MRLNHLDLHVPDVAATRDFLVRHFGFRVVDTRGGDSLAILNDESGFELVVSQPHQKFGSTDQAAPAFVTYHIGFVLPAKEDVDRTHARLTESGADGVGEPRALRGGWLFYCRAPGNVLIEVGWRP